jgi:hypothetical protein
VIASSPASQPTSRAHRQRTSAALALIAATTLSCAVPQPSISCNGPNELVVHIETLGEYQTDVSWAELIDFHSAVTVWQIEARNGLQIDNFRFSPEQEVSSPPSVAHGDVDVVTPMSSDLRLSPDEDYELLVKGTWWQPARKIRFRALAGPAVAGRLSRQSSGQIPPWRAVCRRSP